MNKIIKYNLFFAFLLLIISSCGDYLDIVPDKTQEIDLLFERKDQAYNALAACYHSLPGYDAVFSSYILATDELTAPTGQNTSGVDLMRGKQNTEDPLMSLWSGYNSIVGSQQSLYIGIRDCNTLIDNIYKVADMSEDEKAQWKAEAQFLKAYYHFLLVSLYGPVPITDKNIPISAEIEDVRVHRNSVDQCFDYIVAKIDEATPFLTERIATNNSLGRIDQVIAKSIKAKVLLYAASPLFNGNTEFYENFVDENGNQFFNTTYNTEKWKLAADAAKEAIDLAANNGISLFKFTGQPQPYDSVNYNQDEVQALYNYRYMFTEKWNEELIWGNSSPITGDWWNIRAASLMKNPNSSTNEAAWQWVSPSLRMVELYYTQNGLPIDEDLTFNYNSRYGLRPIPAEEKYHAQEGESTLNLHLSREPRFYASIGFDRGFNRTWGELFSLKMRGTEEHGKQSESNDNLITGYSLKKLNHPSSTGDAYNNIVSYAWPIMRLADLYLIYAEAQNEYYGPDATIYNYLDLIRERSGIPTVEDSWSNATIAMHPNKHLNKDGLREIIRQERMIEMAFEGSRYFDMRRWKEAHNYFSQPIQGLNISESDANLFYNVRNVMQLSFVNPRDYLHPIKAHEVIVNSNLVQNPGW